MKTYNYSILLLICGTVYSFLGQGGSSGGSAPSGSGATPSSSSADATPVSSAPPTDEQNTYPEDLWVQFAKRRVPGQQDEIRDDIQKPRIVIATVPNPTTTHLRVEFDRAIDGIKDAVADDGFLFRRYWFPWSLEPTPQYSDRASQDADATDRARKRRLPGFLLFENGVHDSLIVLLVGESPTDGLDREQLDRAIKFRKKIEDLSHTSDPLLRILGTTFSGSLHSLSLSLKSNGVEHFEAISGTVQDSKSIEGFNADMVGTGNLRTLTHDSITVIEAFQRYLRSTWRYDQKIALLSETDTAFGSLRGLAKDPNFFIVPFPRDIAHLRNAYQIYPQLGGFGDISPDAQQRKNLPLPLVDTRNTIDSIPDFAAQTVVSQETMVSQIANRIRHEHIRFAGIIGTDVLDVLFISRFLRSANPDARLFLIQPDLLFVHGSDALPFEGILAVTTYPLLEGSSPFDDSERSGEKHWMFPTPLQEGIHNAVRVLMADIFVRRVPNLPAYDTLNYGDEKPALWITSVGRDGFLPVAVLGREDLRTPEPALMKSPNIDPLSSRRTHEPTRLWRFIFLGATLAMTGLAFVFGWSRNHSSSLLSDFGINGESPDTTYRHGLQLGFVLVFVTAMYLVVLSTGFRDVFSPFQHADWDNLMTLLNRLMLFLSALIGLASVAAVGWLWWRRVAPHRSTAAAMVLAVIAVLLLAGLIVSLSAESQNLRGIFFSFRSYEISAGSAPTIPLLFLLGGFLAGSFESLQRNILHRTRMQCIPMAKCDPVLGANVWKAAKELRWRLYKPFRVPHFHGAITRRFRMSSVGLAVGAFGVCCFGFFESGIRSFEGRWYDVIFSALASALGAALIVVCRHFLESWLLFSRILNQLEVHPLRKTFQALPDYSLSVIWLSNPRKRSYLIATRSIDALAALKASVACPDGLDDLIEETTNSVHVVLNKAAQGMRETEREHLRAQKQLAKTADWLVTPLQGAWADAASQIVDSATSGDDSQTTTTKADDDTLRPLIYASQFIALRYVAFIQYVMLQLRNMLTFLTLGFLAFAFALMSYPFQGERLLAWLITLLFLAIASGVVTVLVQMETDATLSRITNRASGKLGFAFFHRALAFGALPLLTVLASNFSGVGQFLFAWIEPVLKTLH